MLYQVLVDGTVRADRLIGIDYVSVTPIADQTLLSCAVPDPESVADLVGVLTDQGLRVERLRRILDIRAF
ncbi:hypothetical protein EXU48_06755 [Occultella glacieicola]|uniref:Uncharacterized protein n=1 Tax=Occultella glacieicola TaxID=2518684 RepID=A0ABY2E5S8_9MICO|nr:hypothetical protein [Occultella glacieicola]TDE95946.1 hypothetical protein EXU48_06755 [Occultella glacieicola]